ncbi:MAG: AEC family transporter [Oscillospiraceae bacterium]
MLSAIVLPIVKVFLLIGLGVLLAKLRIVDDVLQSGLSRLVVQVFSPFMALAAAGQELTSAMSMGLIQVAIITLAYYLVSIGAGRLIAGRLKLDGDHKRAFSVSVVFTNSLFLGLPVAVELFGSEGMLYMMIFNIFYRLFLFTYGTATLGNEKTSVIKTLLHPAAIATYVSLIVLFSPWRFPAFLQQTFDSLSACLTPIALIMVGHSISKLNIKQIFIDKYAYLVSFLRLLVFPLLTLLVLWLLGVPYTVGASCIIGIAAPVAALILSFSVQYDTAPQFVSRCVVQSTLFMVVTLPLMLFLCGLLLPQ